MFKRTNDTRAETLPRAPPGGKGDNHFKNHPDANFELFQIVSSNRNYKFIIRVYIKRIKWIQIRRLIGHLPRPSAVADKDSDKS